MTNDQMVANLTTSIALTTAVRDALLTAPEPPSDIIDVAPGDPLQAIIDAAAVGATLRLAAGTYDGALRVDKSLHFVPLNPPPNGQATADASVWLTSNAAATVVISSEADDVSFTGIGCRNSNVGGEWYTVQGSRVLFDRCTGLGDPTNGQHRGWRLEGRTIRLVNCFGDDVFQVARDTSVIGGWQDIDGVEIDKCFLRGGAETIMFGGADAPSAERMPRNIRITSCTLTHKPEWYAMGAQLKTPFELKCAIGVYMADCVLEYAGVAEGQGAYLMVLKCTNQGGKAPWTVVKDVVIERCLCRYGGGGVMLLGQDYNYGSEIMSNVTIRDCRFTGMNPDGYWSQGGYKGSGRCTNFDHAPHGVTFDAITMEGTNMSALGYFANTPKQPTALTLRNWKFPTTKYGWKIDAGGGDKPPACTNLQALMPDMIYEITANDPGAAVARSARQWAD
jgi:hypothetical protein